MAGIFGFATTGGIATGTGADKTLLAITVDASTPIRLKRMRVDIQGLATGTSDVKLPVRIYRGAAGGTLGAAVTVQKIRASAVGTFRVVCNLVTVEPVTPGTLIYEGMAHPQGLDVHIPLKEDDILEVGVRYDIRIGSVTVGQTVRAHVHLEE